MSTNSSQSALIRIALFGALFFFCLGALFGMLLAFTLSHKSSAISVAQKYRSTSQNYCNTLISVGRAAMANVQEFRSLEQTEES